MRPTRRDSARRIPCSETPSSAGSQGRKASPESSSGCSGSSFESGSDPENLNFGCLKISPQRHEDTKGRDCNELRKSLATNSTNSTKLFRVIREIRGKPFWSQFFNRARPGLTHWPGKLILDYRIYGPMY